jgi:predicted NAD/FAD-binding protein
LNYCVPEQESDRVTVTYDMNILQGLKTETEYLVTLNPVREIAPDCIRGQYQYAHPVFTPAGVAAQARYGEIGGIDKRTHFAGAYWGYGFHEDGVKSALRVCKDFGVSL